MNFTHLFLMQEIANRQCNKAAKLEASQSAESFAERGIGMILK